MEIVSSRDNAHVLARRDNVDESILWFTEVLRNKSQ